MLPHRRLREYFHVRHFLECVCCWCFFLVLFLLDRPILHPHIFSPDSPTAVHPPNQLGASLGKPGKPETSRAFGCLGCVSSSLPICAATVSITLLRFPTSIPQYTLQFRLQTTSNLTLSASIFSALEPTDGALILRRMEWQSGRSYHIIFTMDILDRAYITCHLSLMTLLHDSFTFLCLLGLPS